MTDVDDFLVHFGVKGMKWGVRRAEKKAAKADKKWEDKQLTAKTFFALYNAAAEGANKDLAGINTKYSGKNLITDMAAKKKYDQEVVDNFNSHVKKAATARGVNPSGTKKLEADINPITGDFYIRTVDVQHADDTIPLRVERDTEGLIVRLWIGETDLVQSSMDEVDLFLAHYGVKGMKWGVRNKRNSNGRVSSEAERANELLLKAKKEGGVQALSNKELGDLTKRLQLERQYSQLNPPRPGPGKIVGDFLADIGKTQAKRAVNDIAAKQIQVALGKAVDRKAA